MQNRQQKNERPAVNTQEWEVEQQLLFSRDRLQDAIKKHDGVLSTAEKQQAGILKKREEVQTLHTRLVQQLQRNPKFAADPRFARFLEQ